MPTFRTRPVAVAQPVLYQLSIRAPQIGFLDFATYTFPLSPSSLRMTRSAMSSYSNTQGDSTNQGVVKIVDKFGLAPPSFVVEGTTGWDRHLSDGLLLSGLESMTLLKAFLQKYEELNQQQISSGNPKLYALEFYDYFSSEFWQIEPAGPQVVRMSNDKPFLTYYRFQWEAIVPVGYPIFGIVDALADVLATPAQQQAINLASTLGALAIAYGPTGLISSVL